MSTKLEAAEDLAARLRATCSDPHPKGGVMLYPEAVEDFIRDVQAATLYHAAAIVDCDSVPYRTTGDAAAALRAESAQLRCCRPAPTD